MQPSPVRNLLFLGTLLFVILSSGSLQCALNCYERALRDGETATYVIDCHPLGREEIHTEHPSSFCHRSHTSSQAQGDPVLHSFAAAPTLALLNVRVEAPAVRSIASFHYAAIYPAGRTFSTTDELPPFQALRQVRSTVMLM